MSEIKFAVKIDYCPIVGEMIQKLAFKAGYVWFDAGQDVSDEEFYYIAFWDDGDMSSMHKDSHDCPTRKTVSQVIKLLQKPIERKLIVDGENVMFDKNGNIDVGCQHIKFDLVERIYNKCLKMRGN